MVTALTPVRALSRLSARSLAPTVFVLVNAIAFCLVRPGVPDLWAARARAAAVAHGVGLTYWFSWFGGSTPADYSVLTPFACGLLGTEVVAAISAVSISASAALLVRATARPAAAGWMAAVGILINLWCGRVPFLLGAAFAAAALVFCQRRRKLPAGALAVLSVLASPVAGAFVALALSGALLAPRTRSYRATALVVVLAAVGALLVIAVMFGTPGPEPFPRYVLAEIGAALILMLFLAPPGYLRLTLIVSAAAAVVAFVVPNGLGSNLVRLPLFCLPAMAVAISRRRLSVVVALVTPIVVLGGLTSVSAARSAAGPASHASYYDALAARLDTLPAMANHRVELVDVAHAAYATLLDHAVLARGWETQEFRARDAELTSDTLTADSYRAWLNENAVGYVVLDVSGGRSHEERLLDSGRLPYVRLIWRHSQWRIYQVTAPTAIVPRPAALQSADQASLRVQVPCACRTLIRIRWSRFLSVSPVLPDGTADSVEDSYHPTLSQDGAGWTTLTTDRPGTYVLGGSL